MANALFEEFARDNALYRGLLEAWGRADPAFQRRLTRGKVTREGARALFVATVAPKLLEDARDVLTALLSEPDDKVPLSVKDEIAEALILDNPCRGNRLVARDCVRVPKYLH